MNFMDTISQLNLKIYCKSVCMKISASSAKKTISLANYQGKTLFDFMDRPCSKQPVYTHKIFPIKSREFRSQN